MLLFYHHGIIWNSCTMVFIFQMYKKHFNIMVNAYSNQNVNYKKASKSTMVLSWFLVIYYSTCFYVPTLQKSTAAVPLYSNGGIMILWYNTPDVQKTL